MKCNWKYLNYKASDCMPANDVITLEIIVDDWNYVEKVEKKTDCFKEKFQNLVFVSFKFNELLTLGLVYKNTARTKASNFVYKPSTPA